MLVLYYNAVLMCVISTVMCGPMPQNVFEDGLFQNKQKHAIDFFSARLVGNPKVRRNYLDCFLDNGPCSPQAKNIKRMVPDAIKNECQHCSDLQKRVIEKMMCYLNNSQPEILKQIAAKFDPNGDYMKKFINKLENDQFLTPELQEPPSDLFGSVPLEQEYNHQQPQQNENHDQNQPNQDKNKNQLSQSDNQQLHQNHQSQSHHHHQQQPQNQHQPEPQQQPPQNQQQPHHHHHHPQQPQQNQQQPQQH